MHQLVIAQVKMQHGVAAVQIGRVDGGGQPALFGHGNRFGTEAQDDVAIAIQRRVQRGPSQSFGTV